MTLLSLIGLADSIYLTVKHYSGGIVPCSVTGSCEQVLNSSYATVAGVPLAALGALAYFTVFSLSTLAAFGNTGARSLLFYVVLLMFAASIWLLIIQAFVLHAFCQFCLLSAATTLLLTVLVIVDRFYLRRKYAAV
ncbi:MAG: vitamin K epoxide reductase family protein [Acidobacteriota bacterium]|nr:vitamin K epoxide reductase family protein [Acidobacteriota bacterium]